MTIQSDKLTKLTRDIRLLEECISHWKKDNVGKSKREMINIRSSACPLCEVYCMVGQCIGCPIYEDTTQPTCEGSPYSNVGDLSYLWLETKVKPSNFEHAVQEEITYLVNLKNKLQDKLNKLSE